MQMHLDFKQQQHEMDHEWAHKTINA